MPMTFYNSQEAWSWNVVQGSQKVSKHIFLLVLCVLFNIIGIQEG